MARELAILMDDGSVIRDSGWKCVADVIAGFHGFGVQRTYGIIVDAVTLVQVYPPMTQPPDPETQG